MKEKELERITGLSRRQIIQLQKRVITRKNKCVVGIAYDYSDEEVKEFIIAKFFKDCGYDYKNIKLLIDNYKINPIEVLKEALNHMNAQISKLEENINLGKEMLKKMEDK